MEVDDIGQNALQLLSTNQKEYDKSLNDKISTELEENNQNTENNNMNE